MKRARSGKRWLCFYCGQTYPWYENDPPAMACSNSPHIMRKVTIYYEEEVPVPDPLEQLLVSDPAGFEGQR